MYRIILIEDSPETAVLVKEILRGYDVRHFASPVQSYSSLEGADLLILDYHLPDVDGIDFLKYLRENHPEIPVIMITGRGSEDICQSAFRLGVKDYIKKPFPPRELREVVLRNLPAREARAAGGTVHDKDVPPGMYNKICAAKHYIDINIEKRLELEEVLKFSGLSKTVFNRYFKSQFGTTFKDYVLQRKMEKAKDLLKDGFTVSETAHHLGFADVSYFTRIFKKLVGIMPSKYTS